MNIPALAFGCVLLGMIVALKLRQGDHYIVTHHSPTVNVSGGEAAGGGIMPAGAAVRGLLTIGFVVIALSLALATVNAIKASLPQAIAQPQPAATAVATPAPTVERVHIVPTVPLVNPTVPSNTVTAARPDVTPYVLIVIVAAIVGGLLWLWLDSRRTPGKEIEAIAERAFEEREKETA